MGLVRARVWAFGSGNAHHALEVVGADVDVLLEGLLGQADHAILYSTLHYAIV